MPWTREEVELGLDLDKTLTFDDLTTEIFADLKGVYTAPDWTAETPLGD